MDAFTSIATNWLDAVVNQQLDLPIQVIETNRSDALASIIEKLATEKDVYVFAMAYQENLVSDPLEIFHRVLSWYESKFGSDLVESMIESTFYSLHVDVAKAWYRRERHFRKEPILYDESGYEALEFYKSLRRLLYKLSQKHPFVVVLDQFDDAPVQVIEALNQLMDSPFKGSSWGVMGLLKMSRNTRKLNENSSWNDCLLRLERLGLILPLEIDVEVEETFVWDKPRNLKTFEEQIRMLMSATDMFAFRDVTRIVEQVRRRYSDRNNGQMLFLSAFCSLMSDDLDASVRDFTKAQNRLQATQNEAVLLASYYWLSMCYTLKSQEKYARAAQEQCEKLALEYEDRRWYVLSQFMAFYIDAHIAQHKITQSSVESLRHLLSGMNYKNMLALLYTQVYSQSELHNEITSRQYLQNCVDALRIYRTYRNMLGVSIALHAMGVVYMRVGNFRQTKRLYELSLDIREQYQRSADLVPMLNAMGYFLSGQEEWTQAWHHYDRALSMLIEHRNFNEVSVTLYNFIWLYAQSGNTQRALDVMNDLLELMRVRKIDAVPFRNLKDLFVLKGWLHVQLDQPIQARYCLVRLQQMKSLHATSFTMILKSLLSARLHVHDSESHLALKDLNAAKKMLNEVTDLDLYISGFLKLELARLWLKIGRTHEAEPIFTKLRVKAHRLKLDTMAQRVSRASLGITGFTETLLPNIQQPYQVLVELANKETQLVNMQHEISEIYQANLLVDLSADEPVLEKFLQKVINVLDRRVPAEDFAIFLKNGDPSLQPIDLLISNDLSKRKQLGWQERLKTAPASPFTFEMFETHCAAWPLKMGSIDEAWLVLAGDEQQKEVWNTAFLNLVSQQLGLILDRRLREAFLEHRNKTDLLTGVLNRAGLFERLKKQFRLMQREPKQSFALCYFDLDHFKYFNDQFGHELGDRVLKNLVHCVNDQLRATDELGRVGGDEFIILLRDARESDLAHLLERLRASVASTHWWLPLLVDGSVGSENPVPQSEWISASFGVVVVNEWPANGISRIDLIAQGDEAMYEAKSAGKNCVVIRPFRQSTEPHQ